MHFILQCIEKYALFTHLTPKWVNKSGSSSKQTGWFGYSHMGKINQQVSYWKTLSFKVQQLQNTWSTLHLNTFSIAAILAGRTVDHHALLKQFEHLNHLNPETFEVEDLDRLIKSVQEQTKHLNTVH